MKKIVQSALVAALLLGAGAAHAQLSAGHIMLTGSAGYSANRDGTGDDSHIYSTGDISPQVGYFVADNLAIGVGVSFGGDSHEHKMKSSSGSGTSSVTDKTTSMDFGPFVRYYKPVGEHAAFFGQLAAGFGTSTDKTEYSGSDFDGQTAPKDVKYSMVSAGLTPGFTYFPTDHFGLEISMGGLTWMKSKLKDKPEGQDVPDSWEDDSTKTYLDASFGLQGLLIGATWYIGGK